MECPKCGAEIDKNAMVCPNCKKVLKIICPVCRTVNTKNTCRKCGEILVVKCAKCGKINLTKNQKCVKCGYSNEKSAIQGESNTEDFAVLRIDFPNSDVVKAKLGSNQLYTKFRTNLDNMIVNFTSSINVRRQIIKGDVYIIRFNSVYTKSASANVAIEATLALVNLITKLNVKLLKRKGVALKCNFSIMQRNIDDNPYDVDSGFQANMVYQSTDKDLKALDAIQVMTDEDFYDYYNEKYKLETLNSVLVKGKMKQFFFFNLKDKINIKEFLQEASQTQADEDSTIPHFVKTAMFDNEQEVQKTLVSESKISDEKLYNIELIDFDEINCEFYNVKSINVLNTVVEVLQEVPKGILAIKAANMYQPYTLKILSAADETGIYRNIIPITCHDGMKYSPYAFFRELISSLYEYTISPKFAQSEDFSMFSQVDSGNLVKDLIALNQREMSNYQDTQDEYLKVFTSLIEAIPDTLIYIENFEKIDTCSLFILEQLFDNFADFNISFLITYDKDYSLHKDIHFLLSRPYYTEISLQPSETSEIIEADKDFYQNIINDFYFQRLIKYACGSTLFLDFAIQYLVESGIYSYTDTSVEMVSQKTTMVPSTMDNLMKRRFNLLKDNKQVLKFLIMTVLLGTRIDIKTIEALGFDDWQKVADTLAGMGYLYFYNGSMYFSNYSLIRDNITEILTADDLKFISQDLLNKVYTDDYTSVITAELHEFAGNHQQVIFDWEKLANINLSMGDFSSYLNCSGQIIKYLNEYSSDWSAEELEKFKSSIYDNIANNMVDYNPEKIREIADVTLAGLQDSSNNQSFVELCTKMIQGAMYHGEYTYAKTLTNKLLSSFEGKSLDPAAPNFDANFLLMSILHIKILFNSGAYKDCIDIGYNVLNVLDNTKIETMQYQIVTKEEFKSMIQECVACIAISDVVTMHEDVTEFLDISKKLFNFIPNEYCVFSQLQNLIKGQPVNINQEMAGNNLYPNVVFHIINAFVQYKNKPVEFAKEIYKSKLLANDYSLHSFELFADLLIGYSYIQLNSFEKAYSIIYEIILVSRTKGMDSIRHVGMYIMSLLNMFEGKLDVALGMLNNSTIQMEKGDGISEYLTMLNKVNMSRIYAARSNNEQAQLCMNQAVYIIQKYGLNFNPNVDNSAIMMDNQGTEESVSERENNQA